MTVRRIPRKSVICVINKRFELFMNLNVLGVISLGHLKSFKSPRGMFNPPLFTPRGSFLNSCI